MENIVIAAIVVVCVVGAAAWWFMFSNSTAHDPVPVRGALKLAPVHLTGASGIQTGTEKKKAEEDDISKPLLNIYWASQTGTAENFAKGLVAEGRKRGFK